MDWYETAEGRELMSRTSNGKYAYSWVAVDVDGKEHKQIEEDGSVRTIRDVDLSRIKEFLLVPTLAASGRAPVQVTVDLAAGERVIWYWLTDINTAGRTVTRNVLGLEREGKKFLLVLCPSGAMTICSNDNQSYEGE